MISTLRRQVSGLRDSTNQSYSPVLRPVVPVLSTRGATLCRSDRVLRTQLYPCQWCAEGGRRRRRGSLWTIPANTASKRLTKTLLYDQVAYNLTEAMNGVAFHLVCLLNTLSVSQNSVMNNTIVDRHCEYTLHISNYSWCTTTHNKLWHFKKYCRFESSFAQQKYLNPRRSRAWGTYHFVRCLTKFFEVLLDFYCSFHFRFCFTGLVISNTTNVYCAHVFAHECWIVVERSECFLKIMLTENASGDNHNIQLKGKGQHKLIINHECYIVVNVDHCSPSTITYCCILSCVVRNNLWPSRMSASPSCDIVNLVFNHQPLVIFARVLRHLVEKILCVYPSSFHVFVIYHFQVVFNKTTRSSISTVSPRSSGNAG